MNMPADRHRRGWRGRARGAARKEKELTRARDALAAERRRMPWMAVEKEYRVRRPGRPGEPARSVRRAPPADRLPLLLRAGRRRLARARLPRLLDDGRPGRPPGAPERPRHDARLRLPRAPGRHRAAEGADGLGDPLVHDHRRLRHRLRRRRVARHQRLHPRRRPDLPDVLRQQPRRRGVGSTWSSLDITPLGRQEHWEDSPDGYPQTPPYEWWNRHDEYGDATVFERALSDASCLAARSRSV